MNWKLLIAGSLKMMSRYKLRTFFMSLGVMLGVATLIAGRSFGTGAEAGFVLLPLPSSPWCTSPRP